MEELQLQLCRVLRCKGAPNGLRRPHCLRALFDAIDRDGSGSIDMPEFLFALKKLGLRPVSRASE